MPLRPALRGPALLRQCINQPAIRRGFRTTTILRDDTFPDHYATLELGHTASAAEIKKQYYGLSKKWHPDHNADNRTEASAKFVAISDAYHVLGNVDKRERYDRDYARVHVPQHQHHHRHGSHFGHSHTHGPAGGRPASGLSKRRSQFRGPPPSYYAWGGKDKPAGEGAGAQSNTNSSYHDPANGFRDPDPTMPYWDRAAHFRTHEGIRTRKQKGQKPVKADFEIGGSFGWNFLMVGGLVAFTAAIPAYFLGKSRMEKERA